MPSLVFLIKSTPIKDTVGSFCSNVDVWIELYIEGQEPQLFTHNFAVREVDKSVNQVCFRQMGWSK